MSSRRFNVGRFALADPTPESQIIRMYDMAYDDRIAAIESSPNGRVIDMHGMLFKLGPSHLRPSQLEPLRLEGDPLADAVAHRVVREANDAAGSRKRGLYDYGYDAIARVETMHAAGDAAASALVLSMRTPPSWADMRRVRAGAEFFCANMVAAGTCLMNLSLIGGFGAWRINKVLESTGYLAAGRDDVHRRLLETLSFVLSCCCPSSPNGLQALQPDGAGWRAAFAVRLLHSNVRVRLTTCGRSHWDTNAYGLPINVEDMCATLLGFSVVVLLGLEHAGLIWHVSSQECEDYMHLWRLVGHWLGLPEEYTARLNSVASAQCLLESILPHIINSDESSSRLVLASLRAVAFRAPFFWTMGDLVGISRLFSGDFLADCIGIPHAADQSLRQVIDDHHPLTSFPSEIKYVACNNPQLALKIPNVPAAAKLSAAFFSLVFRAIKSARRIFSPAPAFPISFRIMPYIIKYAPIRRWLAPQLHERVKRMVEYRLGLYK